jgi:hypothetical protein
MLKSLFSIGVILNEKKYKEEKKNCKKNLDSDYLSINRKLARISNIVAVISIIFQDK